MSLLIALFFSLSFGPRAVHAMDKKSSDARKKDARAEGDKLGKSSLGLDNVELKETYKIQYMGEIIDEISHTVFERNQLLVGIFDDDNIVDITSLVQNIKGVTLEDIKLFFECAKITSQPELAKGTRHHREFVEKKTLTFDERQKKERLMTEEERDNEREVLTSEERKKELKQEEELNKKYKNLSIDQLIIQLNIARRFENEDLLFWYARELIKKFMNNYTLGKKLTDTDKVPWRLQQDVLKKHLLGKMFTSSQEIIEFKCSDNDPSWTKKTSQRRLEMEFEHLVLCFPLIAPHKYQIGPLVLITHEIFVSLCKLPAEIIQFLEQEGYMVEGTFAFLNIMKPTLDGIRINPAKLGEQIDTLLKQHNGVRKLFNHFLYLTGEFAPYEDVLNIYIQKITTLSSEDIIELLRECGWIFIDRKPVKQVKIVVDTCLKTFIHRIKRGKNEEIRNIIKQLYRHLFGCSIGEITNEWVFGQGIDKLKKDCGQLESDFEQLMFCLYRYTVYRKLNGPCFMVKDDETYKLFIQLDKELQETMIRLGWIKLKTEDNQEESEDEESDEETYEDFKLREYLESQKKNTQK